MSEIPLIDSTGYDSIDNILKGIVGIFETVFPNRIRAHCVTVRYIARSLYQNIRFIDVCC